MKQKGLLLQLKDVIHDPLRDRSFRTSASRVTVFNVEEDAP
jgi:hypothetical protein